MMIIIMNSKLEQMSHNLIMLLVTQEADLDTNHNIHTMITRGKVGIFKLKSYLIK